MAKRIDSSEVFGETKQADVAVSDSAKYQQSREKKFTVIFRENRSFECYVGREFIRFEAGAVNPVFPIEYKDGMPESVINHPDFKIHSKSFSVIPK